MYAKGMTTSDIETHIQDIYGIGVSDSTISRITDKKYPNLFSPRMTACSKCCIWPPWILQKSGPADGRIGAKFMHNWLAFSMTVCPANTAVTESQG